MAHTKAQKAAKGNKDSISKRLGVKIYGNQYATAGNVIIRQKGFKFRAGDGIGVGKDYTLYALKDGQISFFKKQGKKYVKIV